MHSCILQLFMYGSSAFYEKLTRKRILNSIEKVERRCNIIMARSYQDINHGVSCILAGSPPFHLQNNSPVHPVAAHKQLPSQSLGTPTPSRV